MPALTSIEGVATFYGVLMSLAPLLQARKMHRRRSSGDISIPWANACRRCLTDVTGTVLVDVDEVYQYEVIDEDAYAIEGDQIDLAPAVREYVVIEVPDGPLCRPDCAGICPVCGSDRNESPCSCDTSVRDERWAALDDIRLDDDSG